MMTGYGILRIQRGKPDFVSIKPSLITEKPTQGWLYASYITACRELREWASSFNSPKDIRWIKQSGSLCPDQNQTAQGPITHTEVPMDEADGCSYPGGELYVMLLRDGI